MQHLRQLIFISFFLITVLSCNNKETQTEKDYFIKWDNSSLVCIAEGGAYPRLIKLSNGKLLTVYENGTGNVVVKKSSDKGSSWTEEFVSFEAFEYTNPETDEATRVNIANPEVIQLSNGDILLAVNLRPRVEGIYPYSIAIKRSSDEGSTWTDSKILYKADTYFKNGCWEPSFLVLPDETIHIYFANENPYRHSDEQEISCIISKDNGYSWSTEPKTVSFREGHRDGMPVAILDGEMIYLVIEDNVSGKFKPWIVNESINIEWKDAVLGDSPKRTAALKNNLPDTVYAGAPYMIRTESGVYLISYQTTENRTSEWEQSTMEVVISDKPLNFRNASRPFDIPLNKEAKWNSIADIGDNNVAALASTNFNSDRIGVWMIKGKIVNQ